MSLRSVLIGLVLCVAVGVLVPLGGFYVQGTRMGLSSATPAAFFALFLIVIGPQLLLKWRKPRWALRRGELLMVFAMMSVAVVLCTRGFVGPFFGLVAGPAYFAQGGVDWAVSVSPHMQSPFAITDPEVARRLYEGVGPEGSIPWGAWVAPLAWWSVFAFFMSTLVLSTTELFRRQWVEHEHLPFPVARVALALTEDAPHGSVLNPLLRSKVFWIGFAIPMTVESLNALQTYYTWLPTFPLSKTLDLQSELISNPVLRISFLMLGFGFFINSRVAFSLWAFYLLSFPLEPFYKLAFADHVEQLGPWTAGGAHGTIMAHQQMGAMIVLVGAMIWAARRNILRNRLVVGLFALSFLILSGMLWQTGLSVEVAALVVVVALVIWLALTRLMAQAGLAVIVPAIIPMGLIFSSVGPRYLGLAGTVAVGLSVIWVGDLLTFLMGPAANSAFLRYRADARQTRAMLPLLAAVMVGLACSVLMTLWLAHRIGGLNLHSQYFQWFPQVTWGAVAQQMKHPIRPPGTGFAWTGVGAGVMLLLTLAHRAWYWWPLHPLGFMAQGGWIMKHLWFSIFLAWMIKVSIMKWGGGRIYKRATRFFIGIIVGLLVAGGIWLLIDSFTAIDSSVIRVY